MQRTLGNCSETASQSSTHQYRISKKSSWSIKHLLEVKLSSRNIRSSFHNLRIPSHPQPEMLSRTDDIQYEIPFIVYCHEITSLLWNDIELSWKLHLPEHLFWIFTYKFGNVVTFLIKSFCLSHFSPVLNSFCYDTYRSLQRHNTMVIAM